MGVFKAYIPFFGPEKSFIGSRSVPELINLAPPASTGDMLGESRFVMSLCPCHIEENSFFAHENLIIGSIQGS
jgi:hypothetical protein